MAGADVGRIGLTNDRSNPRPDALRGAVPLLALHIRAVNLRQHRIVDLFAERLPNRRQVRLVPVRGELHAVHKTGRQILYEVAGCNWVSLPDQPAGDELRFGIQCCPGPNVAAFVRVRRGAGGFARRFRLPKQANHTSLWDLDTLRFAKGAA
jgi:hypothetical protein